MREIGHSTDAALPPPKWGHEHDEWLDQLSDAVANAIDGRELSRIDRVTVTIDVDAVDGDYGIPRVVRNFIVNVEPVIPRDPRFRTPNEVR